MKQFKNEVMFGDPMIQEISKHIYPDQIIELIKIHPIYATIPFNNFKQSILNKIHDKLKFLFKDKYDQLILLMSQSGAFISGSFILGCILGHDYTDIDIFIPIKNVKMYPVNQQGMASPYTNIEEFMYTNLMLTYSAEGITYTERIEQYINYVRDYRFWDENVDDVTKEYYKTDVLIELYNLYNFRSRDKLLMDKNKPVIQLIQLNKENNFDDLKEFVVNEFDFNICKNLFYIDKDGNDHLYIHSPSNILNKELDFIIGPKLNSSMERYEKYQKKGFKFNDNMLDIFINLL